MHPNPPAAGSAPAPSDPMQALGAQLDDVMAQAEIAANAQRDLDTEAQTPPASTERHEASAPPQGDQGSAEEEDEVPATAAQDESEDQDEGADDEEETGEPAATPTTTEPPKYSRRDAARFASELEQTKRELEQAKGQLNSHVGELAHFRESDKTIRNHLQQQSGYVREQNGRFRYENLSERVLKGTASPEESEEVAQMTQWHEFAAPIYRAAQEMVLNSFVADWTSLKDLNGVGDDGLKKLNAAPSTVAGARELHALAYAAGEGKAKAAAEATIARLRAENKSLKNGKVASAPQPATSNGAAVPAPASFLARAIDPKTGTSTDEFDREVASGKWLDRDLAQA